MGKGSHFIDHVQPPDDVGIRFPDFHRLGGAFGYPVEASRHVFALFFKRPVIAVTQAGGIELDHLGAVGHHVAVFSHNAGRGTNPQELPVVHLAGGQLGHSQLPQEFPRLLVKTHDHPTVAFYLGIARIAVVGADKNPPAGNSWRAVGLVA
jgi:hypothetical protein